MIAIFIATLQCKPWNKIHDVAANNAQTCNLWTETERAHQYLDCFKRGTAGRQMILSRQQSMEDIWLVYSTYGSLTAHAVMSKTEE